MTRPGVLSGETRTRGHSRLSEGAPRIPRTSSTEREQILLKKIDAEKASLRQLWRSVDALLGRGRPRPCGDVTAEYFHRFFDKKVANVRSSTPDAPPPSFDPAVFDEPLL